MQNGNIWAQATGRDSVPLVTMPGPLGMPWFLENKAKGKWDPTPGLPWRIRQTCGPGAPVGATFQQKPGPRSGVGGSEPGWSRA